MTFSVKDADIVGEILRGAAQTQILPRFRNLGSGEVRTKSSIHDMVTDADVEAERVITAALRQRFPGCAVIGEEAVAADRSLLGKVGDGDLVFVVDPVDGTKNFASGLPLFGVMAAAICRGEVVAGIIHDPILDDFAIAVRGEGAWTQHQDGRRTDLKVAAPMPVEAMNGLVAWTGFKDERRTIVARNLPRFAATNSYRCAAHEYRFLCAGHADFMLQAKLMPWDHAAGWLLHREAGGYSARLNGTPYTPTEWDGGIILTADKPSWDAIHAAAFAP